MRRSLLAVSGASLFLLGGGCFGGVPVPVAPGVDMSRDGETINYTDRETGAQVNIGTGATIPANFPSEVPVYPNGTVQSAMSSMSGSNQGASLLIASNDAAATVVAWYDAELVGAGWTQTGVYNVNGQSTATYDKAGATIGLIVTPADTSAGAQTSVLVTWSPSPVVN